jgi:signal transduction histidine kinase
VLRNVASGVVAVDPQLDIALANPQADALLRTPLPPGTRLEVVAGQEISDRVRDFLTNDRGSDEEEFDLELHGRQIHGRLARLARNAGAVLTLDDVTELARAERVLAWGEMARQVAHEIKNPLTPIQLSSEHLMRVHKDKGEPLSPVLEECVTSILSQVKLLRQIEAIGSGEIGNILDIESVSKSREPRKVVPLSSQELQDLFGTIHPSREHVTAERLDKIYNTIDRGEAVCFPIFEQQGCRPTTIHGVQPPTRTFLRTSIPLPFAVPKSSLGAFPSFANNVLL